MDYQLQIAGVERTPDGRVPERVEVGTTGRDVKFDGHTVREGPPPVEVLLDAKDGYRGLNFADLGQGYWQHRADSLVAQAQRQLDAVPHGAVIEWHVSDPYGAAGMRQLLESRRMFSHEIRAVYTPKL